MPRPKIRRRVFSKEFKQQVISDVDGGMSIAEAARTHDVHPETVRLWRKTERKYGDRAFAGNGRAYTDEARIAQLERALGQATLEISLLKKTLSALKDLERKKGAR
jgi:transposase